MLNIISIHIRKDSSKELPQNLSFTINYSRQQSVHMCVGTVDSCVCTGRRLPWLM